MSNSQQETRIAFITGGASGLGLATAELFAVRGMRVVIGDLDGAKAESAADAIAGAGRVTAVQIDVTDEKSVQNAFDQIESKIGTIGVLATFAGVIALDADGNQPALSDTSLADWNRVFAVNTTGTFLCVREFGRRRVAVPVANGRIITVASTAAQLGGPQASAAYSASKGAILSLTKAAAREYVGQGITVNAIAPGPIDTPMLAMSLGSGPPREDRLKAINLLLVDRVGRASEVAAAAAYLASEEAAFVTGSTLDVNGGIRMQ